MCLRTQCFRMPLHAIQFLEESSAGNLLSCLSYNYRKLTRYPWGIASVERVRIHDPVTSDIHVVTSVITCLFHSHYLSAHTLVIWISMQPHCLIHVWLGIYLLYLCSLHIYGLHILFVICTYMGYIFRGCYVIWNYLPLFVFISYLYSVVMIIAFSHRVMISFTNQINEIFCVF